MKARLNDFVERHEVAWELSFAALAFVFVLIGFVEPTSASELQALIVAEWVITAIFAIEFFSRLWAAPIRRSHLKAHWIDLISVIPPGRWLRPFRLLRLLRLVRSFAGISRAMAHAPQLANHKGLIWMIGAWAAVTVLASIGLYIGENGVNEAVQNPFDAMWWGVTTLSTVGYGDVVPTTAEGRLSAMALIILGIGLYSAITAAVTSYFISNERQAGTDLADQLERLARLRYDEQLTDSEFMAAKRAVLAMAASEGAEPGGGSSVGSEVGAG